MYLAIAARGKIIRACVLKAGVPAYQYWMESDDLSEAARGVGRALDAPRPRSSDGSVVLVSVLDYQKYVKAEP